MAEGAAANEEAPTGKRRLGRLAFLAVVIPLVLAAALYLLRGVIFAPSIKSALISAGREHLGLGITVEAIGGSYLGSLTISGLRTVETAGEGPRSPLTSLDVEKIELHYSLLSLFAGVDSFLAGLQVDLRSVRAAVDLGRERLDDGGGEEGGPLSLPARLPRLRLRDSSVSLEAPGYSLHVDGLTADILPVGGDLSSVTIGAEAVNVRHPRFPEEPFSLSVSLGYTPAAVTIEELRAGETVIVEEGRFSLDEMPSAFSFSAAAKLFGGSLDLSGGKRDGILNLRLEGEDVDLGLLSEFFPVPEVDPKGVLSAKIEVQVLPDAPFGVEGELSLSLAEGAVRGVPVNRLLLAASLREGRLEVARLEGETAATAVDLGRVTLPLEAALAGEWKAFLGGLRGEVALDSADIPAFLALWGVDLPAASRPLPVHRLLMEGKMDDGKLSIASGSLETEGGSVQMGETSVAFPGPEESWRETSMKADLTVALDDLALLADLFPLPDLAGSLTGKVLLEGALLSPGGAVDLAAEDLVVDGRPVGDVSLEARLDGRTVTVEKASLRQEGAVNVVELKKVSAPAEDLFTGSWRQLLQSLEGGFSLRLADLPVFLDMLGADAPHRDGEVPEHTLVLEGTAGEGSFRIPSGSLELAGEEIVFEKWEAALPGPEDPWRETALAGTLRVALSDLGVLGDLFPLPHLAGSLKGEATVSGTVGAPRGAMHLQGGEIVVGELPLGEITVDVTSDGGNALVLSLELEREDDASGGGQGYSLSLGTSLVFAEQGEGTIDATIETLKVARGGLSLDLVRPAALSRQADGSYIFDDLELRGDMGSFRLDGAFLPGGESDLLLEVGDLRGEGWLEEFAGDRITFQGLDGSVRFTGRAAAPEITVTGTVSRLEGKRSPLPVSGEFLVVYSGGKGLRFERFELSVAQGKKIMISGFLPLDPAAEDPFAPGEIALTVEAEVPDLEVFSLLLPEEYALAGSLTGAAALSGSWHQPEGKVDLSLRILELPPALQPAPPGPFDLTARLKREGAELRIDDLKITSPAVKGELSGSWTGLPSPVNLIRGEVATLPGDVSLEGRFSSLNAGWMAQMAEGVRYVEGAVEGGISITGPVADPDLRATMKVVDGEVSFRGLPLLSDLDVECRFEDRTLHLGRIEGEVGGAPFDLSGSLSFDSFSDPEIDLRLRGKRLLLYRSSGMRVRSDVDLTARGPLSKLTLAGDMLLTDSRFVKNIDVLSFIGGERPPPIEGKGGLFSFRDPPLRDLVFDLRIKTGEPFLVRNQYVRSTFRPDLTLTGTGEQPLLLGEVKIDRSRLSLPTGALKTAPGTVAFLASDPDRPRIELRGSTRLIGYDIVVKVEGFLDDPRVILASLPALPDDELLLLLLTGTPPASGDQDASASAAGAAMAVFLGRSFLASYFGSEEGSNEMIQDRFETFIGRDISEKGDMTIESTFRLKEKMFWKGDTLYLIGEKDKYDDVNYGVRLTVEFQDDEKTSE